jgi:hypothetical protein
MKQLALGLFALTLLATACKKGKDTPAITKENIAGSYKMIAQVNKSQGDPEEDLYASMPACQKDNLYNLNLDGSFVIVDAGTVCDPPSGSQSTWDLSGNTITLSEETMTVIKFDGSILQISYSSAAGGVPYTTTSTFRK